VRGHGVDVGRQRLQDGGDRMTRRLARRRIVWWVAAVAAVAAAAVVRLALGAAGETTTPAVVAAVIDGDTIVVHLDGAEASVRLLGVDAPERGACGAAVATAELARLVPAGSTVELAADPVSGDRDRYNRLLRYVGSPAVPDVGLALIEAGLVEAWKPASAPEPGRLPDYQRAQRAAQTAAAGSWPACGALGR
jgi:micrococcal nuclease